MNYSNPYIVNPSTIRLNNTVNVGSGSVAATTYNVGYYDDTNVLSYISDLQNEVNDIEENFASKQWVENQGYLTEHQSLDEYATINYVDATVDEIPLTEEQMNELFPIEINQ